MRDLLKLFAALILACLTLVAALAIASCTASNLGLLQSNPVERKEKILNRVFSAANIMMGVEEAGGKDQLKEDGFTESEIDTLEMLNNYDSHYVLAWLGVKPERLTELFLNPETRESLVVIHDYVHRGSGHPAYMKIKKYVLEQQLRSKRY